MKSTGKNFFLILLSVTILIGGGAWFLLSQQTFYADLVFERLKDALKAEGLYSITIDSLGGNPVTGVHGTDISILHDGVEIAEVREIDLKLVLPSLLTSSPRLSSMLLEGVSGDYSVISRHLPEKKETSSTPPPLEHLILRDAAIKTPWGVLDIVKSDISIGENSYKGRLRGKFRRLPLNLNFKVSTREPLEGIVLSAFDAEWDEMKLKASGTISSDLDLHVTFRGVDTDKVTALFPGVTDSNVKGVFDGTLDIGRKTSYSISGEITSQHGVIQEFPFESLKTNITYQNDRIVLENLNASLFGTPLSGRASMTFGEKSPFLSLAFDAKSVDTKKLTEKFVWLKDFPGIIDFASCDLSGPSNALSGPVHLQAKSFVIADFECREIRAGLKIKKSASLSFDFESLALGSSLFGSGDVVLSPDVTLDMNLEIPALSLASLRKKYPGIEKFALDGSGKSRVKIQGPPSNLAYTVWAAFPTLVVSRDYVLRDAQGEFLFSSDGFLLKQAVATWRGAHLTASGNTKKNQSSSAEELDFKGNVEKLSLATLKETIPKIGKNGITGVMGGSWTLRGIGDDPVVGFEAKIPNLAAGKKLSLSGVRATGSYRNNTVKLSSLHMNQGETRLSAEGNIQLPKDTSALSYTLKGKFSNFSFDQLVKAGFISEDISGNATGDIRVWKDPGMQGTAFRVFFRDATFRYRKHVLSEIGGSLGLEEDHLVLENLRATLGSGSVRMSGTVENVIEKGEDARKKTAAPRSLALNVSVASADVGRTIRLFSPDTRGFQGLMTFRAEVGGTLDKPSFTGEGSLSGVRALGLFLQKITFENVSGNMDLVKLPRIRASVGRGVIEGSGSVFRKDGEWNGSFKAAGKSVDIRYLTFSLDDETRKGITGRLDFDFEGEGSLKAFEGHGKVKMPSLSLMRLRLTNVQAPFWVSDGFVVVEESTARAYGGKITAQIAKDLKLTKWGGRAEISGVDFAPAFKDLMPDSEGSISGKLDMKMRMEGDSRRTSMRDGSGSVEITSGEIHGFAGTKAVSRLTGGRPLRFSSALASYNIDGKTLYLLPGSRVSAPKDDPIFKYVMIDGSVTMDKQIDLSCLGNVNIRALNAFAGGISGLLSAALENRERDVMLQNFLGGAIVGFSKNEFRDVILTVKGTPENIRFENIRTVAAATERDLLPQGLKEPSGAKDKEPDRFKITFEFPVGPGAKKAISGDKN